MENPRPQPLDPGRATHGREGATGRAGPCLGMRARGKMLRIGASTRRFIGISVNSPKNDIFEPKNSLFGSFLEMWVFAADVYGVLAVGRARCGRNRPPGPNPAADLVLCGGGGRVCSGGGVIFPPKLHPCRCPRVRPGVYWSGVLVGWSRIMGEAAFEDFFEPKIPESPNFLKIYLHIYF